MLDIVDPLERLLLAAVLGAALGFEREWRQRAAGLRTNTLIALGSALFTIIASRMAAENGSDAARIPAQVVTGIGFLGGGAILRGAGDIRGLTTAAAIWVNAAIGMAAGAGFFVLATVGTLAALVVLTVFLPVDRLIEAHHQRDIVLDPGATHPGAQPPAPRHPDPGATRPPASPSSGSFED